MNFFLSASKTFGLQIFDEADQRTSGSVCGARNC